MRLPIHSLLTWTRAWDFRMLDAYCPFRDNNFDPCCNRCCKKFCRSRRANVNRPVIKRRR